MNFNQTEIIGNQIIIKGTKSPIIIRITLILVLIICVLIPIVITLSVLFERKGLHIGVFLSFFFFWGIGFYLLRTILWNTFGREILTLEDESIIYKADYRFFRDGRREISTKNFEVLTRPFEDGNSNLETIVISDEEKMIETVLKIPLNEMARVMKEIENRY